MSSFITPMLPTIAPSPMKKKRTSWRRPQTLRGAFVGGSGWVSPIFANGAGPRGLHFVDRRTQPHAGELSDQRFSAAEMQIPLFGTSDQGFTAANHTGIELASRVLP